MSENKAMSKKDIEAQVATERTRAAVGQLNKRIREAMERGNDKSADEAYAELRKLKEDPEFQRDVERSQN